MPVLFAETKLGARGPFLRPAPSFRFLYSTGLAYPYVRESKSRACFIFPLPRLTEGRPGLYCSAAAGGASLCSTRNKCAQVPPPRRNSKGSIEIEIRSCRGALVPPVEHPIMNGRHLMSVRYPVPWRIPINRNVPYQSRGPPLSLLRTVRSVFDSLGNLGNGNSTFGSAPHRTSAATSYLLRYETATTRPPPPSGPRALAFLRSQERPGRVMGLVSSHFPPPAPFFFFFTFLFATIYVHVLRR
jgi:hypothetical protein